MGPLVEFRYGTLPDWLSLWDGDCETISGIIGDFIQQAVTRYRGRVPLWHLVHRPASSDILGLTEEEQIRITARAIQVARQADPGAQLSIGIDRPWADWMGSSHFQLGPCTSATICSGRISGFRPSQSRSRRDILPPGSHMRDLFEFSKLLDLYSLLNVPLCIWMALPSATGPDPLADPAVHVEKEQWPGSLDENLQAAWGAKWLRARGLQAVRSHRNLARAQRRHPASLPPCRIAATRSHSQTAAFVDAPNARADASVRCRTVSGTGRH